MRPSLITFSKAIADETRWRIIRLVRDQALCVCELADILTMPQSSVSSHVQIIRKAGMLVSEKREKWTYFRIVPGFSPLLSTLTDFFPLFAPSRLSRDDARCAQRLAQRATSCCPGPKRLASTTTASRQTR